MADIVSLASSGPFCQGSCRWSDGNERDIRLSTNKEKNDYLKFLIKHLRFMLHFNFFIFRTKLDNNFQRCTISTNLGVGNHNSKC
jgi:hypothetical protein